MRASGQAQDHSVWLSGDGGKLQWRVSASRDISPDGVVFVDEVTEVVARRSRKTGRLVLFVSTPTRTLNLEPLLQDIVPLWVRTLRELAGLV